MYRKCLHRNTIYYTFLVEVVSVGLHWLQRGGAMWGVMRAGGGNNGNDVTTADIHLLYRGNRVAFIDNDTSCYWAQQRESLCPTYSS